MTERTLIIIKPDAVQRHLIGRIVTRFENKGLKLIAAKFLQAGTEQAGELYAVHKGKDFYERLVRYISSAPILVTVWQADGATAMARKLLGDTFGYDAKPGTIRGDFGCSQTCNLVHGSDSPESAEFEIGLFFKPEEMVDYEFTDAEWLYSSKE